MVEIQCIISEFIDLGHPLVNMALVRITYMGQVYERVHIRKIGIVIAFVVLKGFIYIGCDTLVSPCFCRLPVITHVDEVYNDYRSKHRTDHDYDFDYPAVLHVNIL